MRRRLLPGCLFAAATFLAAGCGGDASAPPEKEKPAGGTGETAKKDPAPKAAWTDIGTEELVKLVRSGGITMIDNNPKFVYEKRRIPGSKHLVATKFEATDLPADKAAPLMFYCMNED
jgi:hypothetical protein